MTKRDKHLDAVKGFAILVVMLGHCIGRNHMNDPYINDAILTVQMPLFMLVSGYISGASLKEILGIGDLLQLVGRRAVSYLVPFFSWIFVVSLIRPIEEIQNPFLETWNVLFHIDNGLWFLLTLFLITVFVMVAAFIANELVFILKKSYRGITNLFIFAGFVLAEYVMVLLFARTGNTFLGPYFVVQYLPFYVLGYFVSHYFNVWMKEKRFKLPDEKKVKRLAWILWGFSFVVFVYMVIAYDLQSKSGALEMLRQMTASVLGSFVCFYGIYHLPVKRRYGLSFIGLYTLEIYTLHFRFVDMLGFQNRNLSVYSPEGILVILITFFVMSVLSGIIIYFVKKISILNLLLFGQLSRKNRS